MNAIPTTTLGSLIQRYDVFFIDQFGVLRDDAGPYDGAIFALQAVKDAGKTIVILSNSGRSGDYNAKRLVSIGFAPDSFDHFVTSGDVAFSMLSAPGSPVAAGDRCFTISSGHDTNLADRLGLETVHNGSDADVIVISGSQAEAVSMDEYRELLRPAADHNLPCFCTNPDIYKLAEGSIAPAAGSIAKLYEGLGGRVTWIGKPHPEIYRHALTLTGVDDGRRVVCIGDSLEHDILGAQGVDLDSVLVETGVSSSEHGLATIGEIGAVPTYTMIRFAFGSDDCT